MAVVGVGVGAGVGVETRDPPPGCEVLVGASGSSPYTFEFRLIVLALECGKAVLAWPVTDALPCPSPTPTPALPLPLVPHTLALVFHALGDVQGVPVGQVEGRPGSFPGGVGGVNRGACRGRGVVG